MCEKVMILIVFNDSPKNMKTILVLMMDKEHVKTTPHGSRQPAEMTPRFSFRHSHYLAGCIVNLISKELIERFFLPCFFKIRHETSSTINPPGDALLTMFLPCFLRYNLKYGQQCILAMVDC